MKQKQRRETEVVSLWKKYKAGLIPKKEVQDTHTSIGKSTDDGYDRLRDRGYTWKKSSGYRLDYHALVMGY